MRTPDSARVVVVSVLCVPGLASAQASPDPVTSGTAGGIIIFFGFIVFVAGMEI